MSDKLQKKVLTIILPEYELDNLTNLIEEAENYGLIGHDGFSAHVEDLPEALH